MYKIYLHKQGHFCQKVAQNKQCICKTVKLGETTIKWNALILVISSDHMTITDNEQPIFEKIP